MQRLRFVTRRRRLRISVIVTLFFVWAIIAGWYHFSGSKKDQDQPIIRYDEFEPIAPKVIPFKRNFTSEKKMLNVVHIDLKGSPPTKGYLVKLLFKLAKLGVSGVMIEYEDMFPYDGPISDIAARSAFSKSDVQEIVKVCQSLNMEVIPLIQTLGSMEHVLKLAEFKGMREDHFDFSSICPRWSRSISLIEEMIKQVLKLHPNSKRIHIGCGDVTNIKQCPRCSAETLTPEDIFVEHVRDIAVMLRRWYHDRVKPLIWDEMLRSRPVSFLMNTNLANDVEIVFRDTNSSISASRRLSIWYKYKAAFNKIWIAGGFRGADGTFSLVPNMRARLENQDTWIKFIQKNVDLTSDFFVGYILTGDSKSDHFSTSVDLLPASYPSLLLNILKITSGMHHYTDYHYTIKYKEILNCNPNITKNEIYDMNVLFERCSFDELKLMMHLWEFQKLRPTVRKLYASAYENNTWVTPYHVKKVFFSLWLVENSFNNNKFYDTYATFLEVHHNILGEMKAFFDDNVTEDWKLMHLEMYLEKIKTMYNLLLHVMDVRSYDRRN